MAVQETRVLPPEWIKNIAKDYGEQLQAQTAIPLDTSKFRPQVAGQDQLQKDAASLAASGVGAYAPYLTGTGAYEGTPTDMRGAQDYITAAGAYSGPDAYKDFMSPYQESVIEKTLQGYDDQVARQRLGIADLATRSGNLGGGREGVMRAIYQAEADKNKGLLHQQMLQQGYGQAQQLAAQAFGQQQQLGQMQQGLAGLVPSLQAQDISQLGQVGAQQQAYEQAVKDADREAERLKAYEPYERLGYLGSGVTGIMGGYPGQYQSTVMPNPTPLQSALGIGSTLAGMYSKFNPAPLFGK